MSGNNKIKEMALTISQSPTLIQKFWTNKFPTIGIRYHRLDGPAVTYIFLRGEAPPMHYLYLLGMCYEEALFKEQLVNYKMETS